MTDVTRILSAIEQGDPLAAERLLPLIYDELRTLATQKMAKEKPGRTLQATGLVHEAYLRLVDVEKVQQWDSRGHFFAAAAEAMRRILVESARRRQTQRRGGHHQRRDLLDADLIAEPAGDDLLDLDEALEKFGDVEPQMAELVKLRVFAGLTIDQTAKTLGISPRTVKRGWAYAQAWLRREIDSGGRNS